MHILEQLIVGLPMPAQIWRSDGSVQLTNARFNELFGLPATWNWDEHGIRLTDDKQFAAAGLKSVIERALQGVPAEIHSLTFDPSRSAYATQQAQDKIRLFLTIRPILQNNEVLCVACFISDYSSFGVRSELEMMRSQKMENVEILAGGVAHEFNNIFTGIKGMTELIKDEADKNSEIPEFADAIQHNINRGAELIQQLSSFAREVPYNLRPRRLSTYLQEAMPLLQMQVQKRVTLELVLRADGDILMDSNRMDQALANVAHNARDAMGGQGSILISVTSPSVKERAEFLKSSSDWICIEIADSGPGIPDEIAQRVLEPFFTTKERGKATGLGLSVTSRILESHNGTIRIGRSAELGGAALRIYLPLYTAHLASAT